MSQRILEKKPRTIVETSFESIENVYLRYISLKITKTNIEGKYNIRHNIRATQRTPYACQLFIHFQSEDLPVGRRLIPSTALNTPDTVTWVPGTEYSINQEIRLPPARYKIFAGFLVKGAGVQRLPFIGTIDNRFSLGEIKIEDHRAGFGLERSAALITKGHDYLLEEILDLDVYGTEPGPNDHLALCYGQAPQFGFVLEFGVASGSTINALAALNPNRTVWGFDSFEGLPEDWVRSATSTAPAGTFSTGGSLPAVLDNVNLVQGWYSDTLPKWLDENPGNVAFLHVDVDLYSSAKFLLTALNDRIVPSTVIVWDDLGMWEDLKEGGKGGYDLWDQEEWKALIEWCEEHGRILAPTSRLTAHCLGTRVLK